MAAFVVISSNNRLHHLVDDIEQCRPLNPAIPLSLSTGKIIKEDGGYTYEYNIAGEIKRGDEKEFLNVLFSNQLAHFRKACSISKDTSVNVFYLDNPLTDEEYSQSNIWLNELDKVYLGGKGFDANFRIFRVLFTYDYENPSDIRKQMELSILRAIIGEREKKAEKYLFYIDNQDYNSAALCMTKGDHDLKMPRFLLDFMMLISNPNDAYGVTNAIISPTSNTRVFSIGYAESMYYYQDVENYYIHANLKKLYEDILKGDDECIHILDNDAMDVNKYPFGFEKRIARLRPKYENVPFTENINQCESSADKIINDSIINLKELLILERKKEEYDFLNSPEILELKERIDGMEQDDQIDETNCSLEILKMDLQNRIDNVKYNCPIYIDRNLIYEDIETMDPEDIPPFIVAKEVQYDELVSFSTSNMFWNYVRDNKELSEKDDSIETTDTKKSDLENRSGCLSRIAFWKKNRRIEDLASKKKDEDAVIDIKERKKQLLKKIEVIREQLKLKEKYNLYSKSIETIKVKYDSECNYCDNFRLTEHSNHYFPLINLTKLKEQQNRDLVNKSQIYDKWREDKKRSLVTLESIVRQETKEFVTRYSFIDWEQPFAFVESLDELQKEADVCNKLYDKSVPFVNFNRFLECASNDIKYVLYSDRPRFKEEFDEMKSKLQNGNCISAFHSLHISSKICMMQFLPMDQSIIDNLVDIQE